MPKNHRQMGELLVAGFAAKKPEPNIEQQTQRKSIRIKPHTEKTIQIS